MAFPWYQHSLTAKPKPQSGASFHSKHKIFFPTANTHPLKPLAVTFQSIQSFQSTPSRTKHLPQTIDTFPHKASSSSLSSTSTGWRPTRTKGATEPTLLIQDNTICLCSIRPALKWWESFFQRFSFHTHGECSKSTNKITEQRSCSSSTSISGGNVHV